MSGDVLKAPYHWAPAQTSFAVSTKVGTLSMDVDFTKFENIVTHPIRLEPKNFVPQQTPRCHLIGGEFVICKGLVVGRCHRDHDPESGKNVKIARLPTEFRPHKVLSFAAISRESYSVHGHISYSSFLVTLIVTPEGWILGFGGREPEGCIDLSAIRFSTSKGIALVDDVSLHTCDIQGTRLVTLQGQLNNRWWTRDHKHPLAALPESCRPSERTPFICSGNKTGGFHLLSVQPSHSWGCGGDVIWKDGIWNRDKLNLTGIFYEIHPNAVKLAAFQHAEGSSILIEDFRKFITRRFGSLEAAWNQAFDIDGSGNINFMEFSMGCKAAGYVGNVTRIWNTLDDDRSGEISITELVGEVASTDDQALAVPDDAGAQSKAPETQ